MMGKVIRGLVYAFAGLGLYHDEPYPPPTPVVDPRCINSACTCPSAKYKFVRHAGYCKE